MSGRFSRPSQDGENPLDGRKRGSLSNRSNPDVFSDEYSLEPLEVTDDHRRTSISSDDSSATATAPSRREAAGSSNPLDNRAQVTESPFDDNARLSFEGPSPSGNALNKSALNRTSTVSTMSSNSQTPSAARRSLSTSSHFSFPRALSPFTGPTGPSHPYAMYPEGIGIARSPSVATMSTIRPVERPLEGSSAPQHPYAMYAQNTVPEPDAADEPTIPVGFAGHDQPYQRRAAQADDVGDIIGPDGHLEQLPPYSRYPDGVPPKIGMGPASIASFSRDQEYESREDRPVVAAAAIGAAAGAGAGASSLAESSGSSRTLVPQTTHSSTLRPPPGETNDHIGDTFEEKMIRRGSRRVCCGAPVWLFVVTGLGLLIGGIIGGVIGGVLGSRQSQKTNDQIASSMLGAQSSTVTVTATSYDDATPLPSTPPGLLPAPTGSFSIPANLTQKSTDCIMDGSLDPTWDCKNIGDFDVTVGGEPHKTNVLFEPQNLTGHFNYGPQLPDLSSAPYKLQMMLDRDDVDFGPALFFYAEFDKLVILPEDTFHFSNSKRSINSESDLLSQQIHRKGVSIPGDKPWFCWWNHTVLEFFLYINETTQAAQTASSQTTSSPTPTAPAQTGGPARRSWDNISSVLPRFVKIEERRSSPNSKPPYCEQRQVLDDWNISGPLTPDQVPIPEINPTGHSGGGYSKRQARDQPWKRSQDHCSCEWLSR